MSGTITALEIQKHHRDRVNVHLDGQFAFGLAVALAAHLKVGQALGDEDISHLRAQDEVEGAYEHALDFLSYRPRSEAEVRRNLREREAGEEVAEAVVQRLLQAGLLDDWEFARYWVANRLQFSPRGKRALYHELREKGVSASAISDVVAEVDEEAAARQLMQANIVRFRRWEPRDFRRKLSAYLARRGFSFELIGTLVEETLCAADNEVSSDIESEEEG